MGGKRGRPRTPTSKLRLAGTFRPDRHTRSEPKPDGEPYKIAELSGAALVLWDRVVPELTRMKIATALDSAELLAMCEWWGEYRMLQHNKKLEPYKRMCAMAAAYKQFRTIASRFGLTPADRAGLDIDGDDQETNPFAAFVAGRQAPTDKPGGRS
jgi:phage terminase small subunit